MTLDEFVSKWSGKPCDFDGSYGNQCVDLYRMYVKEVLGKPQTPSVVGAKDIWDNCPGFTKIPNSPDNFPLPGDVMIWGSKYGKYGHVAIVTKADINTFTCFSQNDPVGTLPMIKTYKAWSSLLGWLRPEGDNMSEDTERLKKDLAEQQKQTGLLQEQVDGLIKDNKAWEKKYEECDAQRRTAEDNAEGFRKQLKDFVSELATIFNTRHETVEIIAQAKQAITFEDKADELDRKLKAEELKHAEEVKALKDEIERLKTDLAGLQQRIDKTSKKVDNLEKPPIVVTKPPLTFWELVRSIWLKKNSPKSIE